MNLYRKALCLRDFKTNFPERQTTRSEIPIGIFRIGVSLRPVPQHSHGPLLTRRIRGNGWPALQSDSVFVGEQVRADNSRREGPFRRNAFKLFIE